MTTICMHISKQDIQHRPDLQQKMGELRQYHLSWQAHALSKNHQKKLNFKSAANIKNAF